MHNLSLKDLVKAYQEIKEDLCIEKLKRKKYRERVLERYPDYFKKSYRKNKKKHLVVCRKYRLAHREKYRSYSKEYYKNYYHKNMDKLRHRQRDFYKKNKEKCVFWTKRWINNNWEKYILYQRCFHLKRKILNSNTKWIQRKVDFTIVRNFYTSNPENIKFGSFNVPS